MPTILSIAGIFGAKKPSFQGIVNKTKSKLIANLRKFEDEDITKKTFLGRSKRILSDAYNEAYRAGSGVKVFSEAGDAWLKEFSKSQFSFLESFADDIEAGIGKLDFEQRLSMYGDAVQSAYWSGSVMESDDDTVFSWITSPQVENCEDCLTNETNGPYTIESLPGVPGDGQTLCKTNCKCSLIRS